MFLLDALMPILLVVGGAFIVFFVIPPIVMYNRLVNLRNLCNESFADIDTELVRRHELIPNLVNTVKGYAKHEAELLENITRQRAKAVEAVARQKVARSAANATAVILDEQMLVGMMGNLFAVIEAYPDLKADANYRQLMKELAITEDRIQAARRFYNANVRELNNRCQQFPSVIIAKMGSFEQRSFFEIDNPLARANVTVNFGG